MIDAALLSLALFLQPAPPPAAVALPDPAPREFARLAKCVAVFRAAVHDRRGEEGTAARVPRMALAMAHETAVGLAIVRLGMAPDEAVAEVWRRASTAPTRPMLYNPDNVLEEPCIARLYRADAKRWREAAASD